MIESVNNEKICEYAKLNQKKYRDETGLFIIEGEHLVEEAIKTGLVKEIFSLDDYVGATKVSPKVMSKLSSLKNPNKVLAVCHKKGEKSITGNVLAIDNLQDPGNLGTIIRSATAFGIDTIILSEETVDEYNIKVLRASEGMVFHTNIIRGDLTSILANLDNYQIYTTNVVNGENVSSLKLAKPYVLIMGNEGNGVRPEVAALADKNVYIPMSDQCESLNVAMATSIILFEFSQK